MKNAHYTYHYAQPSDYQFSLDSVFFAQKIAALITQNSTINNWKALDLCAGCGVIGFELSHHTQHQMAIDFVEVQAIYHPFFEKNKALVIGNTQSEKFSFLNINYVELLDKRFENNYDLIVCNPPYFFKGEGLLSPNHFKNRCRFFIDSDFQTLIKSIVFTLKPNCCAYLLIRAGDRHGRSPIRDIAQLIGNRGRTEIIDQVRGTDLVMIRKT